MGMVGIDQNCNDEKKQVEINLGLEFALAFARVRIERRDSACSSPWARGKAYFCVLARCGARLRRHAVHISVVNKASQNHAA